MNEEQKYYTIVQDDLHFLLEQAKEIDKQAYINNKDNPKYKSYLDQKQFFLDLGVKYIWFYQLPTNRLLKFANIILNNDGFKEEYDIISDKKQIIFNYHYLQNFCEQITLLSIYDELKELCDKNIIEYVVDASGEIYIKAK